MHLSQLQQHHRQAKRLHGHSNDLSLRETCPGRNGLQMWQVFGEHDALHSLLWWRVSRFNQALYMKLHCRPLVVPAETI